MNPQDITDYYTNLSFGILANNIFNENKSFFVDAFKKKASEVKSQDLEFSNKLDEYADKLNSYNGNNSFSEDEVVLIKDLFNGGFSKKAGSLAPLIPIGLLSTTAVGAARKGISEAGSFAKKTLVSSPLSPENLGSLIHDLEMEITENPDEVERSQIRTRAYKIMTARINKILKEKYNQ